ncbi:MAG TPA: OmpA family protein [Thermoanaerobaculia bacterium]|nr:OmpA family protein [Thermoanaerobaculia bacterium]
MIRKTSILLFVTLFAAACASTTDPDDPNAKAKQGAGIGAAVGAVAGAIIGNQFGNPRTGAVVGAALGAGIGANEGHRMDQQQKELQQIPGVEVTRTAPNEIDVNLTNDILFDYNSYALRQESKTTLQNLADNFRKYPEEQITVEGHTDSIGSHESNQLLSEHRADSVRNYLVDQGVTGTRISSTGYGDTRPKTSNDSPEGRQLNRRVEIRITAAAAR